MALCKTWQLQHLPLQTCMQYVAKPCMFQQRHFAKAQKKKSQSLTQLRADKNTQQYAEILDWWNEAKKSSLDLSNLSPEEQQEFIAKRETYKQCNIERINAMKEAINIASKRKEEAMNALPARLSFVCKVSREPKWKTDLSSKVSDSYFNLHHTAKTTPSSVSSLHLEEHKYYDIHKLRHKDKDQINALEEERVNTVKQYKFPSSPLEYFPALYDPGDIRTQPAYVRSYFDYTWKPGMSVPVKAKKASIDPDELGSEEQVYGRDYSGIQLDKITHVKSAGGSGIGGTERLRKRLEQEEKSEMTEKQRLQKERSKKTAEERAKESLRLEKIRQQKERIKQSVKDWQTELKDSRKKTGDEDGDGEEEDMQDGGEQAKRKEEAFQRMEQLEILNESLPSMEALLVNKELNKEFFEKKLPIIMNHEMLDDEKKQECITLVRKYHTLQTHVGYGVK